MFTGIITAIGTVADVAARGGDRRLTVRVPAGFLAGVRVGDSIACSGVCPTVTARKAGAFTADVSIETLAATTAGRWGPGTRLNLEKALTLAQPLGGHLVSGHVDGTARLLSRRRDARSWRLRFSLPRPLARYVARKGSVCVDGISLTVNEVGKGGFGVNIVPHTHERTTLGRLAVGDPVNLEVDLLARYLERLHS
jgi:riboflavin synthase